MTMPFFHLLRSKPWHHPSVLLVFLSCLHHAHHALKIYQNLMTSLHPSFTVKFLPQPCSPRANWSACFPCDHPPHPNRPLQPSILFTKRVDSKSLQRDSKSLQSSQYSVIRLPFPLWLYVLTLMVQKGLLDSSKQVNSNGTSWGETALSQAVDQQRG